MPTPQTRKRLPLKKPTVAFHSMLRLPPDCVIEVAYVEYRR
nr:hypothetical protein JVH1_3438 [Rhodococcus sp. JVH1]